MVAPKLIAPLGATALSFFSPLPLSAVHGTILEWNSHILIPLYHPAVALYDPSTLPTLTRDISFVKLTLDSLNH
jgi:DNA polymerase